MSVTSPVGWCWVALGITAEPTLRPADGHPLSARVLSRRSPGWRSRTVVASVAAVAGLPGEIGRSRILTAVELEVPYGPSRFVWARRVLLNWDVVVVEAPAGNGTDNARQDPHLVVVEADEHQHVLVATFCDEIDVQPGELDRHLFDRRVDRHCIPVAAVLLGDLLACC